jgi:hypothetical protein
VESVVHTEESEESEGNETSILTSNYAGTAPSVESEGKMEKEE